MITALFLNLIGGILQAVLAIVPKVTLLPDWYITYVQPPVDVVASLFALPFFGDIAIALATALTLYTGFYTFTLGVFIYNKLRGSG